MTTRTTPMKRSSSSSSGPSVSSSSKSNDVGQKREENCLSTVNDQHLTSPSSSSIPTSFPSSSSSPSPSSVHVPTSPRAANGIVKQTRVVGRAACGGNNNANSSNLNCVQRCNLRMVLPMILGIQGMVLTLYLSSMTMTETGSNEHHHDKPDGLLSHSLSSFVSPEDGPKEDQRHHETSDVISAAANNKADDGLAKKMFESRNGEPNPHLPMGFRRILQRSLRHVQKCNSFNATSFAFETISMNNKRKRNRQQKAAEVEQPMNVTNGVDLPPFGIIDALQSYKPLSDTDTNKISDNWNCEVPPRKSCHVKAISVIFMGYRTDRLQKMSKQIEGMGRTEWYPKPVSEIILVWNGHPQSLRNDTHYGRNLLNMAEKEDHPLRIFYALENGLPNDLFNRYHPSLKPKNEVLLYYDDDGPFYSKRAIMGGLELWKRNSDAQFGAMCRNWRIEHTRQKLEKGGKPPILPPYDGKNDDQAFISHCRMQSNDKLFYNFYIFPFFDANVVLPSGSFLHRNYMCFLWHPALAEIRKFVLEQPVRPDDVTVSTIVSHVAGRAPMCYPRRVHPPEEEKKERKLLDKGKVHEEANNAKQQKKKNGKLQGEKNQEEEFRNNNMGEELGHADGIMRYDHHSWTDDESSSLQIIRRRKLLWDDGNIDWPAMRTEAINSLAGYFGGFNSGSIGWCYNTPYHNRNKNDCDPQFPPENRLPFYQTEICEEYERDDGAVYSAATASGGGKNANKAKTRV